MVAPILRCAFIREDFFEADVVLGDAISRRKRGEHWWLDTQIAQHGVDCDVDHVVADSPAVRPTAGYQSTKTEGGLDWTLESVWRIGEKA